MDDETYGVVDMELLGVISNILAGVIWAFIILANYRQIKIRKRFSGLIGKMMFWHTWGLIFLLIIAIYSGITANYFGLSELTNLGTMIFFLIAVIFFWKGSRVIK